MRRVHKLQRRPSAPDITKIRLNVRSRDDIPAILIGLQDPCSDEGTRKRLSGLPGRMVPPGKSRRVGGPGMELWTRLRRRASRRAGPVPAGAFMRSAGCGRPVAVQEESSRRIRRPKALRLSNLSRERMDAVRARPSAPRSVRLIRDCAMVTRTYRRGTRLSGSVFRYAVGPGLLTGGQFPQHAALRCAHCPGRPLMRGSWSGRTLGWRCGWADPNTTKSAT